MSQTENLAAPKASFDRRSVVKSAAWSVPVIAAAIAAPAAAASTPTGTATVKVSFAKTPATTTFSRVENPVAGQNRSGRAPLEFTVQNTSSVPSGTLQGVITIQPVTAGATGVGFDTSNPVIGSAGTFSGNVFSAPIYYTNGVAAGGSLTIALGGYKYLGDKKAVGGDYTMTVTLTHPSSSVATSTVTLGA